MFETLRCRRVFLACFCVVFAAAPVFGVGVGTARLVTPELLKQVGLEIVWDGELPIRSGEGLAGLMMAGERVYALSGRNYLISLDRKTGTKVFSRYAAVEGLPVAEPVLYQDQLIWVLGNRLVEMSERTGEELKSSHIAYGIACPAARNSRFFYVSGVDGRVRVLREADRVPLFEVAPDNDSLITSILAEEQFVIFGTNAGNVISMTPGDAVRLWRFNAAGGIAGRIVRDGASLFFASKDTNVYRVDITAPKAAGLVWKHQVAGVPAAPPCVTKAAVYQYVREKGLTAIDRDRGTLLWSLPEGLELLAESAGRAYVITRNETLTVMDNAAGKRLYAVNFRGATRFVANTVDSKMYVADKRGRIACIQPIRQR